MYLQVAEITNTLLEYRLLGALGLALALVVGYLYKQLQKGHEENKSELLTLRQKFDTYLIEDGRKVAEQLQKTTEVLERNTQIIEKFLNQ